MAVGEEVVVSHNCIEMGDPTASKLRRWKVLQTAALCFASISLGFYLCPMGPSLLDLQITANTSTKSMTYVFLGRSIGGIIGAVLFPFVLSKLSRTLVVSVSCFMMSAVMASLPWLGHVMAVTVVYGIGGAGYTVEDLAAFTLVIRIWGNKNGPWLQAMYACFHIGCVSSQFITKPFLIPNEKEYSSECYGNAHSQVQHSNNTDSVYSGISVTSPMDIQKVHVSELLTRAQNSSKNFITDSEDMISNSTFTFDDSVIATETHIWKAFLIAGIVLFAAAVLNMAIYMLDSHCKDPNSNIKGDAKTKPGVENKGSSLSIALIVHVTVFLFIVCCIQRTINSYLFAYAVQCHSWQKSLAVFLKVCYQSGAFTGRVLSIFLLLHVKPQVLLMVCVLGSVAAFSCIAVIGNQTVVMWLSNVVVGLCMGPMYGCALSWGSQHFTVGAKAGAAISFGVTSSEILGSLVINLMYDKFGLATYSYLNLILMVSLAALVLSMVVTIKCIESKKSKYRYSLANDNKAETAGEETNL